LLLMSLLMLLLLGAVVTVQLLLQLRPAPGALLPSMVLLLPSLLLFRDRQSASSSLSMLIRAGVLA
jgi:hypothetical protein